MKIEELDEFQGLTAEMVREWLHNLDPSIKPSASMADDIAAVSELCGETPQALLREINPRMRKGLPSKAARIAHPLGLWLAMPDFDTVGAQVSIVVSFPLDDAYLPSADDGFGMWHPEGFSFPNQKPKKAHLWSFWPCDEHGNKVRWPTDAEGKML